MPYPPMRPVNPSRGPIYIRCPACWQQVFSPTRKTASESQVRFALAVALAKHRRERHSELEDE